MLTGELEIIDVKFAEFMQRLEGKSDPRLHSAAALLSAGARAGHTCLDLNSLTIEEAALFGLEKFDPESWIDRLAQCSVVGSPGDYCPMILDSRGRLYLHRFHASQEAVAQAVMDRSDATPKAAGVEELKDLLDRLFPESSGNEPDWQKIAAAACAIRRFCVISGGPGTGKTTTAARIIALLCLLEKKRPPVIGLAAPTGKAAARLLDSIQSQLGGLDLPEAVMQSLPNKALTIHRLLGARPDSGDFSRNEKNPLPVDVLIIDEASMIDLALMASIVKALPPHARLILLGDKDQLASVAPGSVLGDLCRDGASSFSEDFAKTIEKASGQSVAHEDKASPLSDCIIPLQKNYRFAKDSGIGMLAGAVVGGKADEAVKCLDQGMELTFTEISGKGAVSRIIADAAFEGFSDYMNAAEPEKAVQLFSRYRILCAVRQGNFGVSAANSIVENAFIQKGLILRRQFPWYEKRPLVINRNDYHLDLFNGDAGCFMDGKAAFPGPDGAVRRIPGVMLPEHETAFAMTVHKSQGSEFDSVLLVLPQDSSPVLTRELLYTAITRARSRLHIVGTRAALKTAVNSPTKRLSGLGDALRFK